MSKKKKKINATSFVNHPRYGDKPRFTNDDYSIGEILASYWGYKQEEVILSTCIEANLDKQNYSTSPRMLYVDLMRRCTNCGQEFIFYAKEQQYWYEELGFFIDADCIQCVECRRHAQELKLLTRKYELLHNKVRSINEQQAYDRLVHELYNAGYIKHKNKLPKG